MLTNLLNAAEAANYLNVAKQTLAVWRLSGRGPVFIKLGRRVAYPKSALDEFIAAHTFKSTSEYPNA